MTSFPESVVSTKKHQIGVQIYFGCSIDNTKLHTQKLIRHYNELGR